MAPSPAASGSRLLGAALGSDPTLFPGMWNSDAISDFTIVLIDKDAETFELDDNISCMSYQAPPVVCITCHGLVPQAQYQKASVTVLKLHTVVLSTASDFFKTLLHTLMAGLCPSCKVATYELCSRQIEAAVYVVKFMYTLQLPTGHGAIPDGMLRVWMIKVSDFWQVPACLAACQAAICSLPLHQFPITSIYSMPQAFFECEAMTPIRLQTQRHLLELYRDASYIQRVPAELKCFTALPHRAVLHLLHSNSSFTDNEATMVLLLLAWYSTNNLTSSPEQRAELKLMIRYGCLTPAYIRTVLPLLPGLEVTKEQERELMTLTSVSERSGKYHRKEWPGDLTACPPSWFPPRSRIACFQDSFFDLRFLTKSLDLQAHLTSVAGMRKSKSPAGTLWSPAVTSHGYAWRLCLSSHTLDSAFSLEVHVQEPSQQSAAAVGVECSIEVTLFLAGGDVQIAPKTFHSFRRSITLQDLFPCSKAAVAGDPHLKHWKRWLQDSHLCIQARIGLPRI